jgi:hypothetical protein
MTAMSPFPVSKASSRSTCPYRAGALRGRRIGGRAGAPPRRRRTASRRRTRSGTAWAPAARAALPPRAADLRGGDGDSQAAPDEPEQHAQMGKRAMAADVLR